MSDEGVDTWWTVADPSDRSARPTGVARHAGAAPCRSATGVSAYSSARRQSLMNAEFSNSSGGAVFRVRVRHGFRGADRFNRLTWRAVIARCEGCSVSLRSWGTRARDVLALH